MSSQISGKALLLANYGATVQRTAAVLPATTTATIYTVTGGRVLLLALLGEVTTVMTATATNLNVTLVPTAAGVTSVSPIVADTSVASLAVGAQFAFTALNTAATTGGVANQGNETYLVPGLIRITTSATNTGAMKWTLLYIPVDNGASVTAA